MSHNGARSVSVKKPDKKQKTTTHHDDLDTKQHPKAPAVSSSTHSLVNEHRLVSGSLCYSHAIRLLPGEAVVPALMQAAKLARHRHVSGPCQSAFVQTAVGSLSQTTLRMASASTRQSQQLVSSTKTTKTTLDSHDMKTWNECVEVVSLVGTFASDDDDDDGKFHLHLSISNAQGQVFGGHLVSATVYTTLEVVLGTLQHVHFFRRPDPHTGYNELVVERMDTTK